MTAQRYPEPIPVVTSDLFVHLPGDPKTLLLLQYAERPDEWFLPGAIFRPDKEPNVLEAGRRRLQEKVFGLTQAAPFSSFGIVAQKGRDFRKYGGFLTDHCLSVMESVPMLGQPVPNVRSGVTKAQYFSAAQIPDLRVGQGHQELIDRWLGAVMVRDSGFEYIRHEGANPELPELIEPEPIPVMYPQPVTVITATWLAYRWDNPWQLLICRLQRGKRWSSLETSGIVHHTSDDDTWVLPGGVYEWHRHVDPLATGPKELQEESGLTPRGRSRLFAIDARHGTDMRVFCGMHTTHAFDHIMVAGVRGDFSPEDVAEIADVRFIDPRTFDLRKLVKGHDRVVEEWVKAQMQQGPIGFRWIL